jgi:hypothetical protein
MSYISSLNVIASTSVLGGRCTSGKSQARPAMNDEIFGLLTGNVSFDKTRFRDDVQHFEGCKHNKETGQLRRSAGASERTFAGVARAIDLSIACSGLGPRGLADLLPML